MNTKKMMLCIFLLCTLMTGCSNKGSKAAVLSDSLQKSDTIPKWSYPFAELMTKIPITPLPFGVEGIDTMMLVKDTLLVYTIPHSYDSLNVYGMNDYYWHNQQLIHSGEEYDSYGVGEEFRGKDKNAFFFAYRLPPTPEHEILLYMKNSLASSDNKWDRRFLDWYYVKCDKATGVIVSVGYLSGMNILRNNSEKLPHSTAQIFLIDNNYNLTTKRFTVAEDVEVEAKYNHADLSIYIPEEYPKWANKGDLLLKQELQGWLYDKTGRKPKAWSKAYIWLNGEMTEEGEIKKLIQDYLDKGTEVPSKLDKAYLPNRDGENVKLSSYK